MVSGPSTLNIVGKPRLLRGPTACLVAGWWCMAKQKQAPACFEASRPATSTGRVDVDPEQR